MNEFLSIALHSWWSFLGTVVLLWISGGLVAILMGGIVATILDRKDRAEEQLEVLVAKILREGKLDDPVYHAAKRARQRGLPY